MNGQLGVPGPARPPKIAWRSTSARAPSIVVDECATPAEARGAEEVFRSAFLRAHSLQKDSHALDCSRPPTAYSKTPDVSGRRKAWRKDKSFLASQEEYVRLNQYKLEEDLGQGSYGIVKLAYNEQDQNHYAMKILDKVKLTKKFAFFRRPPPRQNKGKSKDHVAPDPLGQVNREIAILKKLSHPNIVKLVEVLDDTSGGNYLYMVFEYVERGSVLEIPTEEPLTPNNAWKYFRDTLQGLEYLHYQRIVHRDIKPSNLLLSENDTIKIADFGVSSEFEGIDAFLTGTAGTPAFMAPESLIEDGSHFYSGRAQDIWSLGVTLYCFVYGKVPFWDSYVIALHRLIKTQPLAFPEWPEVSGELKDLISKMLAKDPGFRLMLPEIKSHVWVSKEGVSPLPPENENCTFVTVTEEEIMNSVRIVPSLDTLILIKAMGQRKRFGNPFRSIDKHNSSQHQAGRCASAIASLSLVDGDEESRSATPSGITVDIHDDNP